MTIGIVHKSETDIKGILFLD